MNVSGTGNLHKVQYSGAWLHLRWEREQKRAEHWPMSVHQSPVSPLGLLLPFCHSRFVTPVPDDPCLPIARNSDGIAMMEWAKTVLWG